MLHKYSEEEEITAVGVPNPTKSGTYGIGTLEHIEALLAEANTKIAQSGDPTDAAFLARIYLLGYRDAMMGRKPNTPAV